MKGDFIQNTGFEILVRWGKIAMEILGINKKSKKKKISGQYGDRTHDLGVPKM